MSKLIIHNLYEKHGFGNQYANLTMNIKKQLSKQTWSDYPYGITQELQSAL